MNFPNKPTDGQVYTSEEGVVFVFDKALNTWTQISTGRIPLQVATEFRDGALSAEDLNKINRLVVPPPQSTIKTSKCDVVFNQGALELKPDDDYILIKGDLTTRNIDETGQLISKELPFRIHDYTYGIDFRLDMERFIYDMILADKVRFKGDTGPVGPRGDQGPQGPSYVYTGPQGDKGLRGDSYKCTYAVGQESFAASPTVDLNRALVDAEIIADQSDPTKKVILFHTKTVGSDLPTSVLAMNEGHSSWLLAFNNNGGGDQQIHYVDIDPILDSVYNTFMGELSALKNAYESVVGEWVTAMSVMFDKQKDAMCCALEKCMSLTKNNNAREHMENVAAASVGRAKILLRGRHDSTAVSISSSRSLVTLGLTDHCASGPAFPQAPGYGNSDTGGGNVIIPVPGGSSSSSVYVPPPIISSINLSSFSSSSSSSSSSRTPIGPPISSSLSGVPSGSSFQGGGDSIGFPSDIGPLPPVSNSGGGGSGNNGGGNNGGGNSLEGCSTLVQTDFTALVQEAVDRINKIYTNAGLQFSMPSDPKRTISESTIFAQECTYDVQVPGLVIDLLATIAPPATFNSATCRITANPVDGRYNEKPNGGGVTTGSNTYNVSVYAFSGKQPLTTFQFTTSVTTTLTQLRVQKASPVQNTGKVLAFPLHLDVAINNSMLTCIKKEMPEGNYIAKIIVGQAKSGEVYRNNVKFSYKGSNRKKKISEFQYRGEFSNLEDSRDVYEGLAVSFEHSGGATEWWLPVEPGISCSGRISLEVKTVVADNVLIQAGGCTMQLGKVNWYQQSWKKKECCGCVVNIRGQDYIVVKKSIGGDLACGGGERYDDPCINVFLRMGHPAFAFPTFDGENFLVNSDVVFKYNDEISKEAKTMVEEGKSFKKIGTQHFDLVLFPHL